MVTVDVTMRPVNTKVWCVEVTVTVNRALLLTLTAVKHTRDALVMGAKASTTNCGVRRLRTTIKTRNGDIVCVVSEERLVYVSCCTVEFSLYCACRSVPV